jgi:hypothetical protein
MPGEALELRLLLDTEEVFKYEVPMPAVGRQVFVVVPPTLVEGPYKDVVISIKRKGGE